MAGIFDRLFKRTKEPARAERPTVKVNSLTKYDRIAVTSDLPLHRKYKRGVSSLAILPGTACRWPGCMGITKDPSGYCDSHRTQARRTWDRHTDQRRGSARERGYDTAWDKFRAWFLQQPGNQLCANCGALADTVHHIIPVADRPDLRLVVNNCQALCRDCHEKIHGRG